MERQTILKTIMCCMLTVLVMASAQAGAQPSSFPGRGLFGDWQVKVDFDGRQFESILSFSRDQEGNLTGSWINFMGMSELKDVKYEEGRLSFVQERRNRDGETMISNFKGKIEEEKITGTLSSDRGEFKLEGKRAPRTPGAVGNWELNYKIGDRDITSKLIIKVDKENNLTGQWESQRGESEITDIKYERGNLTFKRISTFQDRKMEMTFEGTVRRDTLTGMIKSERGEVQVEGKLTGAPLIGTWNLEVTSERGTRKQRLRINPDMSGLYGAIPIKKVNLQENKVDFLAVMEFGDQPFEIKFEGKLEDNKITGELTTSRGTQQVKGTKVVRTRRPGTN
ncbi:MAG: hypothetical protein JW837_07725 [Sedimentisphaerales bacterium]|nr:hypothetical protein [Sedimentisphaerales bacterium]